MKKEKKNSQARIDANNRYREKKYDILSCSVPKGHKEIYLKKAIELGYESLNKFIQDAIKEKIERGN